MALRLDERWMWDFWLAREGDLEHLFYLQAPRSLPDPDERHWNVSIGHAVSTDLRRWQVLPDALAPGPPGAWDDYTTWTGCVIRHDDLWWMFYTGTSRAEDGLVQRIGLATSEDLMRWDRHGDEPLIELDPRWYEQLDLTLWHDQAWRDPWVFRATDGRFHAFVTARANTGDPTTRGVIGHAVSDDLLVWEVLPPVAEPGVFGHLEVPQVAEVRGRYWLLFCTPPAPSHVATGRSETGSGGTYALSAADPLGPWDPSTLHRVDGDARATTYGGRLVERPHRTGWDLLVWLNRDKSGAFVGELADPRPVWVEGGRLVAAPVAGS